LRTVTNNIACKKCESIEVVKSGFVKQAVRQGRIPFEITTNTDPFYSDSNMYILRQSIADAEAGKLTEHDLIEV